MTEEQKPQPRTKFWPRRISGLTIVLALLALASFFAVSKRHHFYPIPYATREGGAMMGGSVTGNALPPMQTEPGYPVGSVNVSGAPAYDMRDSELYYPYPYPYPNPDVPVTDTREFLKTYYNASMRTRDVQGLTRRVETTVRGYDGRIDHESSSSEYGSITFAIPQSKYEAFRNELESFVPGRFLSTNISSQNFLPQKQSIEEQQKQADKALADYKAARQTIVNSHTSTAKALQTKIDANTAQLATLRAQTQTAEVAAQIQVLSNELTSLEKQLQNENATYTVRLRNADRNIKAGEDWVKGVQTQDKTLLENVATVNGTVSIQWISLWDSVLLYLPGYWIPSIFTVLTILSFLNDRRRFKVVS